MRNSCWRNAERIADVPWAHLGMTDAQLTKRRCLQPSGRVDRKVSNCGTMRDSNDQQSGEVACEILGGLWKGVETYLLQGQGGEASLPGAAGSSKEKGPWPCSSVEASESERSCNQPVLPLFDPDCTTLASHCTSQSLHVHICKMGIIAPSSWGCREDLRECL